MYTFAITQNEIIELVGDNIRSQIQTLMGGHSFSITVKTEIYFYYTKQLAAGLSQACSMLVKG